MVQWLKLETFIAVDQGSMFGWGTEILGNKILQAALP